MQMANSEALEILQKMYECKNRNACASSCKKCRWFVDEVEFTGALKNAIEALELCVMIDDDGR